nr:MAG TPA: DNA polymerase B [Caudoviricetes sp.]
MIERIGRKKFKIYSFDIESHNDEESIKNKTTSMWLGSLINEESNPDDESIYYYNMDSVIDKFEDLTNNVYKGHKKPCKNACIYIYNLSFEWSFILPVLLKRGFKFESNITKESEYCYNSVSTKSVSSVWQVQIKFKKNSGTLLLRDLAKLYSGGLGKVAKAFGLETQKGEIDYRKNRLHNYQVTQEEKIYCFKDTKIVMDILEKMHNKKDKDFFASCSMASYAMRKMIPTGYPRSKKPYQAFRKEYPELEEEESRFLRHSTYGGLTYATKKWQFKLITQKIGHIDAHQMHPSSAYLNYFPYGKGEYKEGKPTRHYGFINCIHCNISYDDVKLHSCVNLIGIDCVYKKEMWLWDFEIPTMKKCYTNLEIEYIDYYEYKAKPLPWRKFYANNYRERLKAKARKDDFFTLYYKLLNNSSYGKLLEHGHDDIFENTIIEKIDEDGQTIYKIDSLIHEKDNPDLNARFTYIPVGACIPAYSRVNLIETALKFGYENVIYVDTDSIFFIWNDTTSKVWDTMDKRDFLGGWGWEEFIDRAQFTAPKRYKTENEKGATIKAGGINFKNYIDERKKALEMTEDEEYILTFDEINVISSNWKVQRAYRVTGGTIIEFQNKEMKVSDKYKSIYNKNMEVSQNESR